MPDGMPPPQPVNPEQEFTPEFREFVERICELLDENLDSFLEIEEHRTDATDKMRIDIPFAVDRNLDDRQKEYIKVAIQQYLETTELKLLHAAFYTDQVNIELQKPLATAEKVISPEQGETIRLPLTQVCAYCNETVSQEYTGPKPEIVEVEGKKKKGKQQPNYFQADIDLGWVSHKCATDGEERPAWLGVTKKSTDRKVVHDWLEDLIKEDK